MEIKRERQRKEACKIPKIHKERPEKNQRPEKNHELRRSERIRNAKKKEEEEELERIRLGLPKIVKEALLSENKVRSIVYDIKVIT